MQRECISDCMYENARAMQDVREDDEDEDDDGDGGARK